jgi:hypothetical protein
MVKDLVSRIRLGMATELALAGAYLRAECWIVGEPGTELSPVELDLLARIYVQQGRYADAIKCWKKAACMCPEDPTYPQALTALSEYQDRLRLRDGITNTIYVLMAIVGFAAVALILAFKHFV